MQPNTINQSDSLNQIVERLGSANNVLITVSKDPSVDQLAACIGLTLALNKHGKHATAVFSGKIPSTLEFLQPEMTIERNTNSLRDFIISLDKSKADKLRYKVEDEFVKIFITPYKTSIDDKDLNFTQGDFNIDLIITLGVQERSDLDAAIVAHGRIMHDAAVAALSTTTVSEVGTINWVDPNASSLCEMATDLVSAVDKEALDAQIATALLTGMVAETDRFGNEKATPHTMSASGVLMAAGASTQLVSSKLQAPPPEEQESEKTQEVETELPEVVEQTEDNKEESAEPPKANDGVIEIDHSSDDDIKIDEQGRLEAIKKLEEAQAELNGTLDTETNESPEEPKTESEGATQEESPRQYLGGETPTDEAGPKTDTEDSKIVLDPPQLGGQLTANSVPEHKQYSDSVDPMSKDSSQAPLIDRVENLSSPEPNEEPKEQTLSDLEKAVGSHHVQESEEAAVESSPPVPDPAEHLDDARAAVEQAALTNQAFRPEPLNAVGANPVNLDLGHANQPVATPSSNSQDSNNVPPPVPPPMMPPNLS